MAEIKNDKGRGRQQDTKTDPTAADDAFADVSGPSMDADPAIDLLRNDPDAETALRMGLDPANAPEKEIHSGGLTYRTNPVELQNVGEPFAGTGGPTTSIRNLGEPAPGRVSESTMASGEYAAAAGLHLLSEDGTRTAIDLATLQGFTLGRGLVRVHSRGEDEELMADIQNDPRDENSIETTVSLRMAS